MRISRIWAYTTLLVGMGAIVLSSYAPGSSGSDSQTAQNQNANERLTLRPITPIPPIGELDEGKVALGKLLFHDPRLSTDNSVSCASCHSLETGGTDRLPASVGVRGQVGGINAPTVLNASLNFVQFWNGRADTLEAQAGGPPINPAEMGSSWPEILGKLKADSELSARFASEYGRPPCQEDVQHAIAEFERTCITPNSPFDRYLKGEKGILHTKARRGYRLFREYGCISCHQGVNVGGNMYQKLGTLRDYFADRKAAETEADLGRYAVTKREEDRYVFKVPSLRNITLTAPYFHDASAENLPDAIQAMARYQLGRDIPDQDLTDIVMFLDSLTGEQPEVNK